MRLKLIIFLLLITQTALAQTLELRSSLGWGHGWGYNYKVVTNDVNTPYKVTFDRPIALDLGSTQIGIMLDFNYRNKWMISLGRIHGKRELKTFINNNILWQSAFLQKWGAEFYYSILNYKNRVRCYGFVGAFYANNTNFNPNAGEANFTTIDSNGNVLSIEKDTSFNIKPYGTILSCGFRMSFYNIKKHRERFSITFNYDYGLNNLWTLKRIVEYDYLSKYYYAYSTSKGNQIKIYFSKPIKLYDLKKDKYNLFN